MSAAKLKWGNVRAKLLRKKAKRADPTSALAEMKQMHEEAVKEAMFLAFDEGVLLEKKHVLHAIEDTSPLSWTMHQPRSVIREPQRSLQRPIPRGSVCFLGAWGNAASALLLFLALA